MAYGEMDDPDLSQIFKNPAINGMQGNWINWGLPALSGVAGALSNRPSTTTQSLTYSKPATDLTNQILGKYTSMLSSGPGGYISSGIGNINRNADLQMQALQNILASRGISGQAAANAEALQESRRFADVTNFTNQAPLQYVNEITKGLSALPLEQTRAVKEPGNILGGATTGVANALGLLAGMGNFGGGKALSTGSILSGLGKVGGSAIHGIGGAIGTAGSTIGHGIGSIGGAIGGLGATTLGIGAGAVGAALLAKHFIGQGRKAANKLTGEGGLQRGFNDTLHEISQMDIPEEQKWQHYREAYDALVPQALEFAKKGSNEFKVASQMFDTISPIFGLDNPLAQTKNKMNTAFQQMLGKFTGAS